MCCELYFEGLLTEIVEILTDNKYMIVLRKLPTTHHLKPTTKID